MCINAGAFMYDWTLFLKIKYRNKWAGKSTEREVTDRAIFVEGVRGDMLRFMWASMCAMVPPSFGCKNHCKANQQKYTERLHVSKIVVCA